MDRCSPVDAVPQTVLHELKPGEGGLQRYDIQGAHERICYMNRHL